MNHHEPEDLHGDVRDLDQTALTKMKMMKDGQNLDELNSVGSMGVQLKKDDQRKRDGWMDGQNWRVVFSHPFRSPLFRFSFDAETN
jgi:plasmid maintenance system killer protein